MDRKLLIVGAAFVGLMMFWVVQRKNSPTGAAAETQGMGDRASVMQQFEQALSEARQALRAGRHHEAALKLYHRYPAFEAILQAEGYKEIAPGTTLNSWFATRKTEFVAALNEVYPALLAKLKEGEMGWREMDQIFNYLPFPFGNDLKRKYSQQDRPEIARARAAQAPNWCYVTISSSTDSVANYERLVREALRDRWDGRLKLKLIFDSPSNGEEKRAAAKIINVHIEEKMVEYAAQNQARGRGEAAEKAVVRFSDQTSRQGAPGSNWDRLPAIIVTNEAPEQLFFKFTNDKQEADFSGIARRQREALEQKLALALRTVPRFELLQSKGY